MLKWLLIIPLFFRFLQLAAQDTGLTSREKALLDSMLQNDEFLKLIGQDPDISYLDISAGISNAVFSLKNNSLNAGQAETRKLYYTGSAAYYHKTGLAIAVDAFFANDKGNLVMYQSAINPSYSYINKKISAGISYSRFINATNTSFEVNPYKNDLYANIDFLKPWWRPGIAVGFSSGNYEEVYDSVITYNPPAPFPPRTVHITDTITTKLRNASFTFSASHKWKYKKLFNNEDEFQLRPSFLINISNQHLYTSHSNSLNNRRPIVQKLLKAAYGNGASSEPFRLQSAAFLVDASYSIGRFNFAPQLYIDYYFPQTDGNRFSIIYSFVMSCAF